MTNFEWMRNRLLAQVVVWEIRAKTALTIDDLENNWKALSVPLSLMKNRMMMGRLRYPAVNAQSNRNFDRVFSIKQRLSLYESTGTLEHLVDIANIACIEFVVSKHPNKNHQSIDDGIHTIEK